MITWSRLINRFVEENVPVSCLLVVVVGADCATVGLPRPDGRHLTFRHLRRTTAPAAASRNTFRTQNRVIGRRSSSRTVVSAVSATQWITLAANNNNNNNKRIFYYDDKRSIREINDTSRSRDSRPRDRKRTVPIDGRSLFRRVARGSSFPFSFVGG